MRKLPAEVRNRASLVAEWLRIRLPMQGTQVRALIQEDPICRGATKPVCHNYWACALETASHNCWARVPQLLKPVHLEPMLPTREATTMRSLITTTKSSPCSPQTEKSPCAATKTQHSKNKINKFIFKKRLLNKKLKTQITGKIFHADRLEELIFLRWPY